MNRRKRAQRAVKKLQGMGQIDAARRLVEAFDLDEDFDNGVQPDESLAEIDDVELAQQRRDLEVFIPTAAALPDDIEDEESLVFDTGVFRIRSRAVGR